MVSMMTYFFSARGFGHPVFLKPHFGHPVMKILAKTLDERQLAVSGNALYYTAIRAGPQKLEVRKNTNDRLEIQARSTCCSTCYNA